MLSTFGDDGPLQLAEAEPAALYAAIEQLLDDPAARETRAVAGAELMAERTWQRAAIQVQDGLRSALRADSP
jgi:hypothetical protein